jgi:hypothetical protein
MVFLGLQSVQTTAADSPQSKLGGKFGLTELGKVPEGWKIIKGGDWAVRLDEQFAPEGTEEAALPLPIAPQREKECLLPRVLGTDLQGGMIQYDAKEFGDFTFTYQMKHATERDYWCNEFRFRIQSDGKKYYLVRRERFGQFTLACSDGKSVKTLVTSEGKLDAGQAQWVWVRVIAEGNHIQVRACTDGVSFEPLLDYSDTNNTLSSGKIAFAAPKRFRFAFLENPWDNDADKKLKGSWLTRIEQAQAFRQIAGTDSTQYQMLIEYFVDDPAKAPTSLSVTDEGKKKQISLTQAGAGFHLEKIFVALRNDVPAGNIEVCLSNSQGITARASAKVVNSFSPDKLPLANPKTAAPVDSSTPVGKKDYLTCLDKAFAKYGNTGRFGWDNRWSDNTVMYRATGEKKYLDRVMEWTRIWIKNRSSGKTETPDFHFASRPGFASAATLALEKGDLAPDEKKMFLDIIADVLATGSQEGSGIMNRALGYALPIKPLLKLVPNHPMRKQLMKYHDVIMYDFMATREVQENSSNYMPITALYLISWIDDNGLQDMYQDPKLRQSFENMLQILDPSGGLPQFADYGGKHLYSFKRVAVFERLATVYKDGRFKWAAHQMTRQLLKRFNVEELGGFDTEALAWAYYYADDSIPEIRPTNGSIVTSWNTGHLDKLVLRSGWGPDDFHALVDFVNGREHGDNEALALLSVYKNGGQSLIDKAGRDISNHSLPLIRESAADMPYLRQPWDTGRWYQASFDLKLFSSWGQFSGGTGSPLGHQYLYGLAMLPYDFTYNPAREFAFAWGLNVNGKVRVYLDDVKLIKSGVTPDRNEKEKILEDFEGPAYRWIGNFQKSDGARSGKCCGRFDVDFSESNYIGKKFPMPLDVYGNEYDRIEFWFKFEPVTGEIGSWATLHLGDKSGTPRNYPMDENQSHAVKQLFFKDGPLATFAGFNLDDRSAFGGAQSRERDFLFVKNKILWIRDRIRPDTARPYAAGSSWQVGKLAGAKGENWYDTWIDSNLLLWFVPKPYAVIQMLSDPQPKGYEMGWKKQFPAVITQYAEGAKPDRDLVFDTLLLPHRGEEDAAKLAAQIKVLYDKDDVTLIQVGEDLILCNPSGKEVSVEGLVTDCRMLFVTGLKSGSLSGEGVGGKKTEYKGRKIDSNLKQ